MQLNADSRIVMTLDAGGTNLRFSAIRGNQVLFDPIHMPTEADNLTRCLANIVEGFTQVRARCPRRRWRSASPFPARSIIRRASSATWATCPAFAAASPWGRCSKSDFGLPVFLNNDGDLFAYGEAISGFLPYVNERLKAAGSAKQYKNLFGITLGTGFGAGIVRNGELFIGDNAAAAEIWVMRGKLHNRCFVEEDVSIRAVQRVYAEHSKVKHAEPPTPKDIYEFASGSGQGDQQAAILAFSTMGEAIGDALANAITLIDGLVVIGGGLSAAAPLFMPRVVAEMNGTIETLAGQADSAHGTEGVQSRRRSRVRRLRPRRSPPHHRARQQSPGDLRSAEANRRRPVAFGHEPGGGHRGLRLCAA